ncbi:MAG TPA: hypothetical protein VJM46_02050 [Candidatus Saccharimonadales bacterium]|nr:hypothetical protein [Candidatus Saccharimonadales bacterium]
MAGKKKKFSYYNDYSTVNFGGSGRRSSGDSSRSRGARDHNWCQDCFGSGKCQHCKDGSYPRRDGSKATCGKCRGNLSCHACRGSRHGGKKCGTPTYEETLERIPPKGRQSWTKYTASIDYDAQQPQTNFFMGYVGERDQRRKVHVVIDVAGDIVYVRDLDGTVLYDSKRGTGHLPPDLNWSR